MELNDNIDDACDNLVIGQNVSNLSLLRKCPLMRVYNIVLCQRFPLLPRLKRPLVLPVIDSYKVFITADIHESITDTIYLSKNLCRDMS